MDPKDNENKTPAASDAQGTGTLAPNMTAQETAVAGDDSAVQLDLDPFRRQLIDEDDEDEINVLIRHRTVQRYKVDRFEFRKFEMRLKTQKDLDEFIEVVRQLPPIERNQFDIINERAVRSASTPLFGEDIQGTKGIRGPQSADSILTQKDREAIAASRASGTSTAPTNGASAAVPNLNNIFGRKPT